MGLEGDAGDMDFTSRIRFPLLMLRLVRLGGADVVDAVEMPVAVAVVTVAAEVDV